MYACNLDGNPLYGESVDGGDIACNFLQWLDSDGLLGLVRLRPMTELEFEKACRGPQIPVANEYPWGTTTVWPRSLYNLENVGSGNEAVANNYSTTVGNALYSSTNGPFQGPVRRASPGQGAEYRPGYFGASYYGIQELGGNLVDYGND